ncbi:MAG: 30S ribosomal protein S6e [Candidatus Micrarchaeota archaeon]|nr:30S ribosomal protein S6e [Candidatus Micrarchaeota archaeon]MDE1804640.1 30S ribosomal protein S6e [Candidatus Micrarchaeota archaeon]MDE1846792.1 30S ribosomal protein S6e [Candidatus Micrarchaeota archaeon]
MKIVFSDRKTGKTAQLEVAKDKEAMLLGKKIGEQIDGFPISLDGFKFQITGMSDKSGTPSRSEIEGTRKAKLLLSSGAGLRYSKHGYRARRLVRGSQISVDTEQINTFIVEYGAKPLEELFKPKEKKSE